jgi:hypothetical protein
MPLLAGGAIALVALGANLGAPLRQDGFAFRPPAAFRAARMALFHGTGTGAIALDRELPRHLATALVDGDEEHASSLLVSVVYETFEATPSSREAFSAAAVRHFADELEMPLALEQVELVRGDSPRIEVVGTVRQQDQLRRVLIAAMEGEGKHGVIIASVPSGRFEALLPELRASLDTYRPDVVPGLKQDVAGSIAALLGLGLFASWWVWRRRTRLRRAERGLAP